MLQQLILYSQCATLAGNTGRVNPSARRASLQAAVLFLQLWCKKPHAGVHPSRRFHFKRSRWARELLDIGGPMGTVRAMCIGPVVMETRDSFHYSTVKSVIAWPHGWPPPVPSPLRHLEPPTLPATSNGLSKILGTKRYTQPTRINNQDCYSCGSASHAVWSAGRSAQAGDSR